MESLPKGCWALGPEVAPKRSRWSSVTVGEPSRRSVVYGGRPRGPMLRSPPPPEVALSLAVDDAKRARDSSSRKEAKD